MSRNTIGRLVEVLKSVRAKPMSRDDIMTGLGWSKNTVFSDLDELERQGLLVRVELPPNVPGKRHRVGFRLSPQWGGPQEPAK